MYPRCFRNSANTGRVVDEYAECKGNARQERNSFCSLLKFTSNRSARIRMTQADGTGFEGVGRGLMG
jgi:hypothetical protein